MIPEMIKNLFLLFAVAIFALPLAAGYPEEWTYYTSPACLHDVQTGQNDGSMSETTFRNYLVDLARTNLAKTVKLSIADRAELSKQAVDGKTSTSYSSLTMFSTDVELSLVKTASCYDRETRTGYAIAYIEKKSALEFYHNAVSMAFDELEVCLCAAEDYWDEGLVSKAEEKSVEARSIVETLKSDLFLINFFGADEEELSDLSVRVNEYARRMDLLESRYAQGILICLECHSVGDDAEFEKELKGLISKSGCSFTDKPETADWIVSVDLKSEEYNVSEIGGMKVYSVYANAGLTVKKNKGKQVTVEDFVSQKGVHTLGFEEATRSAFDELPEKVADHIILILSK